MAAAVMLLALLSLTHCLMVSGKPSHRLTPDAVPHALQKRWLFDEPMQTLARDEQTGQLGDGHEKYYGTQRNVKPDYDDSNKHNDNGEQTCQSDENGNGEDGPKSRAMRHMGRGMYYGHGNWNRARGYDGGYKGNDGHHGGSNYRSGYGMEGSYRDNDEYNHDENEGDDGSCDRGDNDGDFGDEWGSRSDGHYENSNSQNEDEYGYSLENSWEGNYETNGDNGGLENDEYEHFGGGRRNRWGENYQNGGDTRDFDDENDHEGWSGSNNDRWGGNYQNRGDNRGLENEEYRYSGENRRSIGGNGEGTSDFDDENDHGGWDENGDDRWQGNYESSGYGDGFGNKNEGEYSRRNHRNRWGGNYEGNNGDGDDWGNKGDEECDGMSNDEDNDGGGDWENQIDSNEWDNIDDHDEWDDENDNDGWDNSDDGDDNDDHRSSKKIDGGKFINAVMDGINNAGTGLGFLSFLGDLTGLLNGADGNSDHGSRKDFQWDDIPDF